MTKKSSSAAATATEKVAALVAPAGEQPAVPITAKDTARKCFPKKRSSLKMFASFPQTSGNLKKNKKKGFRPQIHKFSTKLVRQKLFLQVLLRAPRRNNIAHDIGTFSTGQKIVLSSSRGLAGFEAKAKDFTFEA